MEQTTKIGIRLPQLSGNALKWIAALSMLLDHIGASLIEGGFFHVSPADGISMPDISAASAQSIMAVFLMQADFLLRLVGRLSFPLFCFLLVEGFLHTHNFRRYALRLLLFAFLSEIPFDLALFGVPIWPYYQNVFFTLLTGLLVLWGFSRADAAAARTKNHLHAAFSSLPQVLILFSGFAAVMILQSDYDVIGVLLIAVLYLTRQNRKLQLICGACICVLYSIPAAFAFLLLFLYNGKRGKGGKRTQYFFYAFYPLHLLLFGLVRLLCFSA